MWLHDKLSPDFIFRLPYENKKGVPRCLYNRTLPSRACKDQPYFSIDATLLYLRTFLPVHTLLRLSSLQLRAHSPSQNARARIVEVDAEVLVEDFSVRNVSSVYNALKDGQADIRGPVFTSPG